MEGEGFRVVALKKHRMTKSEAEGFYAEHAGKGFFPSLVTYMTSGPVFVAVLERENAVAHWRAVMGATDPAKADAGTIRKEFGQSIERNASHGSANPQDAAREVVFFFSQAELI
jgi:nucleoside-diphosphate kinase